MRLRNLIGLALGLAFCCGCLEENMVADKLIATYSNEIVVIGYPGHIPDLTSRVIAVNREPLKSKGPLREERAIRLVNRDRTPATPLAPFPRP